MIFDILCSREILRDQCQDNMAATDVNKVINQLADLRDFEEKDFLQVVLNNKSCIFDYALTDVIKMLEERNLETLRLLRQSLWEQICACENFEELTGNQLVCRRYKHTLAPDIYYLGHSLMKGTLLNEVKSIFAKKISTGEDDGTSNLSVLGDVANGDENGSFVANGNENEGFIDYGDETERFGASDDQTTVTPQAPQADVNEANTDSDKITMLVTAVFDVKKLLRDLSSQYENLRLEFHESTAALKNSLNEAHNTIANRDKKCSELEGEVRDLNQKIKNLETSGYNNDHGLSLLIGDGLLKEIDDKKLQRTNVKSLSGAKIDDVAKSLSDKCNSQNLPLNRIYICVGTNDCAEETDIETVVESYRNMVEGARKLVRKAADVVISSVPPRGDKHQDRVQTLNAAITTIAEDMCVTFVNNDINFMLPDGSVNDGFLLPDDSVFLSRQGVNRLVKNLKISVKPDHQQNICKKFKGKKKVSFMNVPQDSEKSVEHVCDDELSHSFWAPSRRKVNNPQNRNHSPRNTSSSSYKSYATTVKSRPSTQSRSYKRCDYCGEHNHSKSSCGFKGPATCRQCNQPGHKQKFCVEYCDY